MSELTQLLRSQYTTNRHIIAGVGEHTTTAGQTSSHFFGRLVQRIERSLSAEVRQRNRAGVDAYIAQIRAVNADLADAAAAALAETRAQGKPLTVHRVRELGGDEISRSVQQQAAAARLQQIKAIPFEDLNDEQIRFLQEVPVQSLGYLTRRLAQIHHLKHETPAAERPKGPSMESAIRNVLMRHSGDALRLGGTALSLRVAANLAAGV